MKSERIHSRAWREKSWREREIKDQLGMEYLRDEFSEIWSLIDPIILFTSHHGDAHPNGTTWEFKIWFKWTDYDPKRQDAPIFDVENTVWAWSVMLNIKYWPSLDFLRLSGNPGRLSMKTETELAEGENLNGDYINAIFNLCLMNGTNLRILAVPISARRIFPLWTTIPFGV